MKACEHVPVVQAEKRSVGHRLRRAYLAFCSDCGYRVVLIDKMPEHPALVVRIPKKVQQPGRWVGDLLHKLGHWGSYPSVYIDSSLGDVEFS
jgi:hypothetical protein